jgi:hypothetical protein
MGHGALGIGHWTTTRVAPTAMSPLSSSYPTLREAAPRLHLPHPGSPSEAEVLPYFHFHSAKEKTR